MKQQQIPLKTNGDARQYKSQACVKAVMNSNLTMPLKKEMEDFINRNTLKDCGKVPPNCLKAHLIRTAKKFKFPAKKINSLKNLFKSKIGYKGYYLDKGKLKKA